MDLDATDRYGFVMPNPLDSNAQPAATEPAGRDKDLEARRIAKWRKMLGVHHADKKRFSSQTASLSKRLIKPSQIVQEI